MDLSLDSPAPKAQYDGFEKKKVRIESIVILAVLTLVRKIKKISKR
jgi:hypothetical protein